MKYIMDNIEIFDKDGNKLNVADVIYDFIKDASKQINNYE
jgi:hypothetical protein